MSRARFFLSAAILFLAVVAASAQTARKAIEADLAKASHIFNMYPEQIPDHARPPKGYKPFYVSHVGRHGARFALGSTVYEDLVRMTDKMQKAVEACLK